MTSFSPTYQPLQGRESVLSTFDTSLEAARQHVLLFDRDGYFYGLDRRLAAERIQVFLLGNALARMEIIVHDSDFIEKRCPRLVAALRRFAPRLSLRTTESGLKHFSKGFAVFDDKAVMRRPHFDHGQCYWDTDEHAIGAARDLMEQLREQSSAALQVPTGL